MTGHPSRKMQCLLPMGLSAKPSRASRACPTVRAASKRVSQGSAASRSRLDSRASISRTICSIDRMTVAPGYAAHRSGSAMPRSKRATNLIASTPRSARSSRVSRQGGAFGAVARQTPRSSCWPSASVPSPQQTLTSPTDSFRSGFAVTSPKWTKRYLRQRGSPFQLSSHALGSNVLLMLHLA